MKDSLISDIASMVRHVLRNPDIPIDENTSLESLGVDSLDLVELLFLIEDKFQIDIPYNANQQGDAASFTTVGAVADAIRKLLGQEDALPA